MITFSDLELVATLCDSGSLSEAARKLRVTTAALSMRLRKLEAQLGLKLASRDARRLVLTEEGERMAEEGRRLLRSLEELSDSMVADDDRLSARPGARQHAAPDCACRSCTPFSHIVLALHFNCTSLSAPRRTLSTFS